MTYFRQLDEEIETYFDANIAVELISSPGIGKSDWVEQLRARLERKYAVEVGLGIVHLAHLTPPDLNGFMHFKHMPDGSSVSMFSQPTWLFSTMPGHEHRLLSSYPKAIVFLDEYGQGDLDVKKGAANLFLHGSIGTHRLGRNVHRIAASNRMKDRSGVTKNLDFVINRRAEIHMQSEFISWEDWAVRHLVPPIFILYAKKYGLERMFKDEIPTVQQPWSTPRSYAAAVRFLEARRMRKEALGEDWSSYGAMEQEESAVVVGLLTGIIGEAEASGLMGWLRMKDATPDLQDIINDPDGTFVPDQPDAKLLTVYEAAYRVTEQTMKPIVHYIGKYSPDYHVTFAKAALKRNHKFITNNHMERFIKGNTALLNAIGQMV